MSDVDDELLALAGGDVSSDEDDAAMDMSRDQSRSPSRSRSPTPPRKDSASKGGVAAKKGNAGKGRKRGSRSDQESDEEGEASSDPGSPASQQSAPMDESDSDSDAPQARPRGNDDEGNQYPIEGLFRDYEERAKIMGMREIEREQILAERREENERIRQNRMLRQLKVNQEKDFKKRKASAADLDDDQRKTTRVRSKTGETTDKMDSLRRAREERISRKEQRERESDRRKPETTGYGGSPGRDDDDSEVDWTNNHGKGKGRSRSPEPRVGPPADLRDVERVRVGRSRFAEVCFYPGFDEAITGCFVRINIGPDPVTRQDVYRMAMIKGFTQGRPYAIPDSRGHQMVVDTYVKAAHGKAQKDWPFFSCSDKGFTESEWERYKKVCAVELVPIPDRDALVAKIADINKLVQRKWTEQELSEKLKRQNDLHVRFSGIERDSLQKQLDAARLRGDDDALVARLQDRLDSLETPRLAFKTSLVPQSGKKANGAAGGGSSQQEKLARLNAENRKRNAESVRKAQLVERHKARETNRRHHQHHDEAVASGAATPAKNGGADTPGGGGEVGTTPVVMPHVAKLQELQNSRSKNGIPTVHRPLMDDDVIGALDLDIDLEIE